MFKLIGIFTVVVLANLDSARCWDSEELEVFDVVEEVNENFYTLLDVPNNANQAQIKKAFRRLSLVLHPDKNDAPDAEVKFRQLVSVYDILKDSNKRNCYDNVLENGLPDWKQAIYYYRRVRKMGLAEMSVILFIIISIGQYLVGWAQYFEHKFNVDDYLSTKAKKLMKKNKKGSKNVEIDPSSVLPPEWDLAQFKPSIKNTLPFQIPRFVWFVLFTFPGISYKFFCDYLEERKKMKEMDKAEQEESSEEEIALPTRGPRRRKVGFTVPEVKDGMNKNAKTNKKKQSTPPKTANGRPVISGGLWTDDDLVELVKLVKKFPTGTSERWDKIGEAMRRPPTEVAHMAHKVKDDMVKTLGKKTVDEPRPDDSDEEDYDGGIPPAEINVYIIPEPKKVKTRGGKLGATDSDNPGDSSNWSQVQQKALESALAKYPKAGTTDRWEKIAKCVPDKTKEECMLRFKQLVELVKKKKDTPEESNNSTLEQEGNTKSINNEVLDSPVTNGEVNGIAHGS